MLSRKIHFNNEIDEFYDVCFSQNEAILWEIRENVADFFINGFFFDQFKV